MDPRKMDSRKRDEWRERRREEVLARRMGEALDRFSSREAGGCPDADIVAAYHERALGPEETAQWESHFAGCARCRKILAVLAASVDAPLAETEVARLGELVASAGRSPSDTPSKKLTPIRPGRWDWRARWLAPALGVAAVLAMWFAVRPPWRATEPGSPGTLVAQAPKNEVPPSAEPKEVDRFSKVAPQSDQKSAATTSRDRSASKMPSLNSPVEAPAERRADAVNGIGQVSPSAEVATSAPQNEKKLEGTPEENATPAPAPTGPPRAVAKTETEAQPAMAAPQAQSSAGGIVAGTVGNAASLDKLAPTPQPTAGAMATPGISSRDAINKRTTQSLGAFKATAQTPVVVNSPSGSILWRAGKGGSIERSTDAGRTYAAQTSPLREDWLGAAAVSDTAAWLVGRNGAIARTTDGENWARVTPPSQATDSAAKLPDWIEITARDVQIATVTARDGRRFATQDGGKTWQSR